MTAAPVGEPDPRVRLRELETLLEAFAGHALFRLDLDGRVAGWTPMAERLLGYRADEALGRPVAFLYTEEDRAARSPASDLAAARESGRTEVEGWRVRKDGSRFMANMVFAPIRGERGEVTGLAVAVRDVTGRLHAEAMFRGLLETAPDGVVIVGPDGRIRIVNRQAEALFGYEREELIGKPIEVLIPERFRDRHDAYRRDYARAPRIRPMGIGLELYGRRRDGSEFPVEISLGPLETDQGTLVTAVIRDVTEHREQEQRLQRQRDEIMELSTPVIQVWDKVLALPIIGTLDSLRAARLTEGLLQKIADDQAEIIILDISGVPTIDTQVAQHLLKTVQAATLMGAESILSGVRPETAQAMVHLGIDFGRLRSRSTLRDALRLALRILADRAGAAQAATGMLRGEQGR